MPQRDGILQLYSSEQIVGPFLYYVDCYVLLLFGYGFHVDLIESL